MIYLTYQPNPMCRWRNLWGDQPETTFDADRLKQAVAKSVHFEGAGIKSITDARYWQNMLHVIQREILKDAATVAYSRAVTALKDAHKARVEELSATCRARIDELKPLLERLRQLDADRDAAVNQAYTDESSIWYPLAAERDREIARLEEALTSAKTFAEEAGRELDAEAAQLPARIEALKAHYEGENTRLHREREATVTRLKRECEEARRPIWVEYQREQEAAQQAFKTAKQEAEAQLRKDTEALHRRFVAKLEAAEAELNAAYGPMYEAADALEAAAKALAVQMKTVRGESGKLLATHIAGIMAPDQGESTAEQTPGTARGGDDEAAPVANTTSGA